jgi:aspartate-semialdehyde dehydrogenase
MPKSRIPIAVLGATGAVGQKAIRLLLDHPTFQLAQVSASPANVGRRLGCLPWGERTPLPPEVSDLRLVDPTAITTPIAFSALPSVVAGPIEAGLLERGIHVVTNASDARLQQDVALLIPEVNPESLQLLQQQKTPGKRIAGTNCVVAIAAPALHPLISLGNVEQVSIVTLQAISGAGRSGLSGLDIQNNTIPYIAQEEEKVAIELTKVLQEPSLPIMVNVNRVPVVDGHSVVIHLRYSNPVSEEMAKQAFKQQAECYSDSYCIHDAIDMPQPKVLTDDDMRIHIGRIRSCGKVLSLVAMGHNLVRGAAGTCLASAQLAVESGLFSEVSVCR